MLKETIEFLEGLKGQKKSLVQGLEKKETMSTVIISPTAAAEQRTQPVRYTTLSIRLDDVRNHHCNDGSKDNTHQVALDFASSSSTSPIDIRVVRPHQDRGKRRSSPDMAYCTPWASSSSLMQMELLPLAILTKLALTLSRVVTRKGHGVAVAVARTWSNPMQ